LSTTDEIDEAVTLSAQHLFARSEYTDGIPVLILSDEVDTVVVSGEIGRPEVAIIALEQVAATILAHAQRLRQSAFMSGWT
jgi:hypothetical protein